MVGKVTTEGDRAMSSDLARLLFGLDGSGIKIGVISDSFNAKGGANTDVLNGDLPGPGNPNGYTTPVRILQEGDPDDADEGRAMAQIIHDIAPGAELLFYRGPEILDENEYVQAINALADAGADIIVDDVGLVQPFFQDGKVAQAVDGVVSRGVAYFGAVGNSGGTTYESPFRPGQTRQIGNQQYLLHDFDPGPGIDTRQKIELQSGRRFAPYLQWSQPFDRPTTRLELFLVDENNNLLIGPPNNDGTDRSGESLSDTPTNFGEGAAISFWNRFYRAPKSDDSKPVYLVIGKRLDSPGPDPSLIKWKSALTIDPETKIAYSITGSTLDGHANARGTTAVGASNFLNNPAFGIIDGPFLERFSSYGGTPILFDKDGNPLPQPEIRRKPEIVAPNGVSTATTGSDDFASFSGTSAAAPHAAAVAALLLQRAGGRGSLTPTEVRNLLQQTALTMDPQPNFTTGAGFIRADQAVIAAAAETKTGNAKANRIRGTELADNLFGRAGNDQLGGLKGKDALFGAQGNDQLRGQQDNDYLVGNTGKDTLIGGAGKDVLVGGRGADVLTGGAGVDTFLVNDRRSPSNQRSNVDVITDFKGNETIALSTNAFTTFVNPNASDSTSENPIPVVPFGKNPSFITVRTLEQAEQSAAAIVYIRRTGAIYYNANGTAAGFGGGGEFANVTPGLKLSATNFEIVA